MTSQASINAPLPPIHSHHTIRSVTSRNTVSLRKQALNIHSRKSRISITTHHLFDFTGLQVVLGFCLRDFFLCEDFGDGIGEGVANVVVVDLMGVVVLGVDTFGLVGVVEAGIVGDWVEPGARNVVNFVGVLGVGTVAGLVQLGTFGDSVGLRGRQVFLEYN